MPIKPQTSKIKNRAGVIDVIAQDSNTGEAVLVMNEPEPWDDSDERLLALQERFNAYVSFLLDGEMAETNPDLAGRPARISPRNQPRKALEASSAPPPIRKPSGSKRLTI